MTHVLKTGDILHCSGKGIIARLIQRFTKSKHSHTAIFVSVWGQDYIIDAQSDGVNLRPFEAWRKKFNYQFEVTRTATITEREFALKALSKVGVTAYDFGSLVIKQPWMLLTGEFAQGKKDPEAKMYCSEYVAWCHGWDSFYRMNPKNVYNRALEMGHKVIDHPFNKSK